MYARAYLVCGSNLLQYKMATFALPKRTACFAVSARRICGIVEVDAQHIDPKVASSGHLRHDLVQSERHASLPNHSRATAAEVHFMAI